MIPGQLQAVADETRAAILRRYSPQSCIATTRAVIEVLRYYGVTARPRAARVKVFNEQGWELAQAGVPFDDWPLPAWSISVDDRNPDPDGNHGVGHVVAVAGAWLIDASIDQVNRPRKGIMLGPLVAALPATGLGPDGLLYKAGDGTRLYYAPSPSRLFTRSRNWRRDQPELRETVAEAIRAVRARDPALTPP